jgi:hypothetical protein
MISWRSLVSACLLVASTSWGASFFEWTSRTDILAGGFYQQNEENIGNPSNQVLNLPGQSWDSEIKPSIKIESTRYNFSTIIRPRMRFQSAEFEVANEKNRRSLADYGFWEAYVQWELIKFVDVAIGIKNTQWGPSDLLSPSQFMFPELLLRPEPFQSTQGLELAQIQWTPSQEFSLLLISELDPFRWEHFDSLPLVERRSQKRSLKEVNMRRPRARLL